MEAFIRINKSNVVEFIHCAPFDPSEGMGLTREELLLQGKIVHDIPQPNASLGQKAIAMYNPDTNTIYYRYETIPLKDNQRIDLLEKAFNDLVLNQMKEG